MDSSRLWFSELHLMYFAFTLVHLFVYTCHTLKSEGGLYRYVYTYVNVKLMSCIFSARFG